MFPGVAKTILLVRFFIFCGVMWVLSYVFSIFCTCITSFGDFTRLQHQKTTMRTYARYTIYNLEIWDVSFPQSFEFPGTNYPRCQRCLSFLISVFFFFCAHGLYHPRYLRTDLWSQGEKRTNLRRGNPRLAKHKSYWLCVVLTEKTSLSEGQN